MYNNKFLTVLKNMTQLSDNQIVKELYIYSKCLEINRLRKQNFVFAFPKNSIVMELLLRIPFHSENDFLLDIADVYKTQKLYSFKSNLKS